MQNGSIFDVAQYELENENRRAYRIGCYLCLKSNLWETHEEAPNTSFQRTRVRGGWCPLNSDRFPPELNDVDEREGCQQ